MPVVSVILPVWNAAATIERAVRSVLDQTLQDLELIVVDDGSDDETRQIVSGIEDSRLRLIPTGHRGVAAAANRGLTECRCSLIARMDADDVAHPKRLERQSQWLAAEQLDVVGCQVRIVDGDGRPVASMQRYQRWINEETLTSDRIAALRFVELPVVNPTILARRHYFELGFAQNSFPEDYDLMLRAAELGLRFGKVPESLLSWTDGPDRLTRNHARYTADAFENCRRAHLLNGPLTGPTTVDLWGVGQTGKPWLRWLQKNGFRVRVAYDINPRVVGRSIHGVPVFDAAQLATPDGTPLIVAVGADGARQQILEFIEPRGYRPGNDTWFVA